MADATGIPPVAVEGVSKSFRIPTEQVHTLKERALHPFRRREVRVLQALDDVSFQVTEGEFFGIVGRNGSGKSTLLKCLAGIYAVAGGRIYVNGRMSTFIELGVGFNPDLAARDNILLNGTMLGLSPREARRRVDAVLDFSELYEFVDLKIKNYSSGMLVRLAFAVMIQVDADILLIDEVLAVGDAAFQQKCYEEFERIHRSGKTVLLVTHDMNAVRRFCTRAMLLEHGHIVSIGDPEHVGSQYLDLNFSKEARAHEAAVAAGEASREAAPELDAPERFGDGGAEILEAWCENADGERVENLRSGERCAFVAKVAFSRGVEGAGFSLALENSHHDLIFSVSSTQVRSTPEVFDAGEHAIFRVELTNVLSPDRYFASFTVESPGGRWLDRRERLLSPMVTGTVRTGGLVQLPHELEVQRVAAPESAAERVG